MAGIAASRNEKCMGTLDRAWWIRALRAAAEPALAGTPLLEPADATGASRWVDKFKDGSGNRRLCDGPMLRWMLGLASPADAALSVKTLAARNPDAALWWLLHVPSADPMALVDGGNGPLFPRLHAEAIEMWTEAELSGLHALWWHAQGDEAIRNRCLGAAEWLIAEIQPDNATNRPWSVHVFAEMALGGNVDAQMYAQTLMHNCIVGGSVDRFSACVMWNAAACMQGA